MKNSIKILLLFILIVSTISVGLAQQISVRRIINPNPLALQVSSYGTTHCAGTPGPEVYMNTTENNTIYQMWQDLQTDVLLSTQDGNGGNVNFGDTNDGTMYVMATNTNTGCTNTMANEIIITSLPIPNVEITASGPTTGCGTLNVTLSVTYESGCTYQWLVNNEVIPNAISNTYVATVTNTTKVFTCVATNADDCEASDFIIITSNPYPSQFAVSTTTPTFCAGEGVVNVNGTNDGILYHLSLGGEAISTITGTGAAYSWTGLTQSGTYTVTAENAETGCELVMGSTYLSANPLPTAAGTITGPTSVCQGAVVTYTTTAIANADSYVWSFPDGNISSGQGTPSITLEVSENGTSGNITVMGQNSCGAGPISSFSINVMAAPIINATTTPNVVCAGNTVTLNAGGNASSYSWSNGLGGSSITTNPTATTTYYVTATGSNGCTSSDDVVVTVNPLPNVTLNLSPDAMCQGEYSVQLTGGSPAGGTYIGGCISGTNTVYGNSSQGTWAIEYTYTDPVTGCSNTSNTDNFVINPEPWVDFDPFYPASIIPVDEPAFIVTAGSPYGGDYNGPGFYQVGTTWWFNASIAGIGTHVVSYTYTQPSTGCDGDEWREFVVGPAGDIPPENGIEEITAAVNAVRIFPNPTNSYLNLHGINTQEIVSFVVVDITGRILYEQQNLNEDMQLDVANFVPGTYLIRFTDIDGFSVSKRFMKSE